MVPKTYVAIYDTIPKIKAWAESIPEPERPLLANVKKGKKMKTIWGIFHTFRQVDAAVVALQARGYTAGTIHALAPEAPVRQAPSGPTPSGRQGCWREPGV